MGTSEFHYLGIKFQLEVPDNGPLDSQSFHVRTTYDHSKRAAGISVRILEWNKALQDIGVGAKLTFRNASKGPGFTFSLSSREMEGGKFSRREFRHCLEYFVEMSIKLHNIIFVNDVKRFEKVRLTVVSP